MTAHSKDPGFSAGWCIHYRGLDERACGAGIPFSHWQSTPFDRRPCFLQPNGQSKPGARTCTHIRRPTSDEIKAHNEWVSNRLAGTLAAFELIKDWRKENQGKSAVGHFVCPVCNGVLLTSISSINGHVHGQCQTAGCLSWME